MNLGDNKTSSVLNKTCSMTDVYAPHSAITKKLKKKKKFWKRNVLYWILRNHHSIEEQIPDIHSWRFQCQTRFERGKYFFIGQYGYGINRNTNGDYLAELLCDMNLLITTSPRLKHLGKPIREDIEGWSGGSLGKPIREDIEGWSGGSGWCWCRARPLSQVSQLS